MVRRPGRRVGGGWGKVVPLAERCRVLLNGWWRFAERFLLCSMWACIIIRRVLGPSSHVRNTFVVISQKLAIATTAKQVIYFPELTYFTLHGLVS